MTTIEITVGRLLCGKVRSYLDACKFKGWDVNYLESSGLLERDFVIIGSASAMSSVHKDLNDWMKAMEVSDA